MHFGTFCGPMRFLQGLLACLYSETESALKYKGGISGSFLVYSRFKQGCILGLSLKQLYGLGISHIYGSKSLQTICWQHQGHWPCICCWCYNSQNHWRFRWRLSKCCMKGWSHWDWWSPGSKPRPSCLEGWQSSVSSCLWWGHFESFSDIYSIVHNMVVLPGSYLMDWPGPQCYGLTQHNSVAMSLCRLTKIKIFN